MSFQPDDIEHERALEQDNEEIIALLKRAVMLLETIADFEIGSTKDIVEDQ